MQGLVESLARSPREQLDRIAAVVGLAPGADRGALVPQMAKRLTDPQFLATALSHLSDEEWAALKVVVFNGGDQGITVELCYQIVNMMTGKRRKTSPQSIEALQQRGLVYIRNQNYRQVFYIPTDLMAAMTDILNAQLVTRVCLPPDLPIRSLPADPDLLEDLHRFLAYIHNRDVTLTQQGQIFKRHLRALAELLLTSPEEEETLVGRYPEPLGLLVGFSLDRHLISREEGHLRPTARLDSWLSLSSGEKLKDLFEYWQDRYFYQDLQSFLTVIRSVGARWVAINSLTSELEPMINPSQRGSFPLRLKHHLGTFLGPLGLFHLGEVEDDLVCKLSAQGQELLAGALPTMPEPLDTVHPFMLQATFEIVAPRPLAPSILWQLELMADLVSRTDRTLTYRVTKQAVYRALKAGCSGEEMLAFLERCSATGLPQNVAFDLRSWASAYGQVYVQELCLLRCTDPLIAQQVKASRRTGKFILGELTPSDLIIAVEDHKELLEALEADGLMPKPGIERPGATGGG